MGDHNLRFAFGIMGNVASSMLYAAPILTFQRVIRKRSTEEFSCIPYLLALMNCLLYTWYGLPVVSYGWENFPVATINGLGILLESSFIFIYIWFASTQWKKVAALLVLAVMALFCVIAFVSTFALHDHGQRKIFVGSVGLVASVSMYGSPLVAVKRVVKTRSVEFMPLYLSLFSFIASTVWMAYGLLGHDFFVACPNFLGSPMGLLQIVLYCMFRGRNKGATDQTVDIEQTGEKFKTQPQQQVLIEQPSVQED